jgi:hypothetical protein
MLLCLQCSRLGLWCAGGGSRSRGLRDGLCLYTSVRFKREGKEGKGRGSILAELGLVVLEIGEKLTHYEAVVICP